MEGTMILCPSCGLPSSAGKKFCADCGSPLPATCPVCGAEVQPGKRFCGDCGASLTAASAPATAATAPAAAPPLPATPPAEARRLVSVLFCDMVGFTPLAERLDADEVRATHAAYLARI